MILALASNYLEPYIQSNISADTANFKPNSFSCIEYHALLFHISFTFKVLAIPKIVWEKGFEWNEHLHVRCIYLMLLATHCIILVFEFHMYNLHTLDTLKFYEISKYCTSTWLCRQGKDTKYVDAHLENSWKSCIFMKNSFI